MTQEEKRIKIAEACGWKSIERLRTGWHGWHEQGPLEELPDYLYDLNAMHEAEKVICGDDFSAPGWLRYLCTLDKVINQRRAHATAAQRAEALGLTLGLWT